MEDCSKEENSIRHIVISGGAASIFPFYGTLSEAHKQGIWNYDNLRSIYAVSSGSILAVILALQYEWSVIDDFLIKRPWNQVFKMDFSTLMGSIEKRGIMNTKTIEDTLSPLLKGKDYSTDITLMELYEKTGIELHIITTVFNKMEAVDLNHLSHPHWRVIEAVCASCSLPILFPPLLKEGEWYCDGGCIKNYPIERCIGDGALPEEIIGIYKRVDFKYSSVEEEHSLFDYLIALVSNFMALKSEEENKFHYKIAREYSYFGPTFSLWGLYAILSSVDRRVEMIEEGRGILVKGG